MEVSGQFHDPAASLGERDLVTHWIGRLGGPQNRSGQSG
jgi:hypothetical protein